MRKRKNVWKDYYSILHCNYTDPKDIIWYSYLKLVSQYHVIEKQEGVAEIIKELQEAISVLNNPARRKKYDITYHDCQEKEMRRIKWQEGKIAKFFASIKQGASNLINSIFATVTKKKEEQQKQKQNEEEKQSREELKNTLLKKHQEIEGKMKAIRTSVRAFNGDLKEDHVSEEKYDDFKRKLYQKIDILIKEVEGLMIVTTRAGFVNTIFVDQKRKLENMKEKFPNTYTKAIWGVKKEEEKVKIRELAVGAPVGVARLIGKLKDVLERAYQNALTSEEYEAEVRAILDELENYKKAIDMGIKLSDDSKDSKAKMLLEEVQKEMDLQLRELNVPYFVAKCGIIKQKNELDEARIELGKTINKINALTPSDNILLALELHEKRLQNHLLVYQLENYVQNMLRASSIEEQRKIYYLAILEGLKVENSEMDNEIAFFESYAGNKLVAEQIEKWQERKSTNAGEITSLEKAVGVTCSSPNLS